MKKLVFVGLTPSRTPGVIGWAAGKEHVGQGTEKTAAS